VVEEGMARFQPAESLTNGTAWRNGAGYNVLQKGKRGKFRAYAPSGKLIGIYDQLKTAQKAAIRLQEKDATGKARFMPADYYERHGLNKSFNAIRAQKAWGQLPINKMVKELGVSAEKIKHGVAVAELETGEWHHHGANLRRVDYYDLEAINQSPEFWRAVADTYKNKKRHDELNAKADIIEKENAIREAKDKREREAERAKKISFEKNKLPEIKRQIGEKQTELLGIYNNALESPQIIEVQPGVKMLDLPDFGRIANEIRSLYNLTDREYFYGEGSPVVWSDQLRSDLIQKTGVRGIKNPTRGNE